MFVPLPSGHGGLPHEGPYVGASEAESGVPAAA